MHETYVSVPRTDQTWSKPRNIWPRTSELHEFDFVPLKRAARYLVGKPKAALRFRRQKFVDKITVHEDSAVAGDPVSRKSTTGLVAQIGNHTVKSGSTLQSLTALSVGEAEFYAVVKGGQVGPTLRSICQDLGIPMKVEIQSDSSTANSLTDRLGAGQRTKHIDTRYFLRQKTSSRRRSQHQEGAYSEQLCRCWNVASLCFITATTLHVCRIGVLLTMDPPLHYKMMGHPLKRAGAGCATQKQTIVSIGHEL